MHVGPRKQSYIYIYIYIYIDTHALATRLGEDYYLLIAGWRGVVECVGRVGLAISCHAHAPGSGAVVPPTTGPWLPFLIPIDRRASY